MNEAGARVKFQKNGGCPGLAPINTCSLDEIQLTGVASIQSGPIGFCKNEFLSASDGNANNEAQNIFSLDSQKVLTLTTEVNMKEMGGPRHIVRLLTDGTNGNCIIHAQIMILPKSSAIADISYEVSDVTVLDEMKVPGLSYFQDTGVKLEFIVTFHDNVQCAIDFYEDVGDMSKRGPPIMKFGNIGVSVDGTEVGSAQQSWIECESANCWSVARRDRMEELDLNYGRSWSPGEGGCKVKAHFEQFTGEIAAIAYQDKQKVTYNFGLLDAGSIGFKPSKYNGQTLLNAFNDQNEIVIAGEFVKEFDVQDVDNMPPIFCGEDPANCPAESYHRSAYNQY